MYAPVKESMNAICLIFEKYNMSEERLGRCMVLLAQQCIRKEHLRLEKIENAVLRCYVTSKTTPMIGLETHKIKA